MVLNMIIYVILEVKVYGTIVMRMMLKHWYVYILISQQGPVLEKTHFGTPQPPPKN